MDKLLLTPEEAAQVLGVSRSKMYELIARRAVKSVKIGSLRRVPKSALEDYVSVLAGEDVA